jgi:hypothetical protein
MAMSPLRRQVARELVAVELHHVLHVDVAERLPRGVGQQVP